MSLVLCVLMYFNLSTENKELIIVIITIIMIVVHGNYYSRIKITYRQKHMIKLLRILSNLLVVKVVFSILTTIKGHLFTHNFGDPFKEIGKPRKL